MSQTELSKLLKDTWKALALADHDEAEELLAIVKTVLEKLESFEIRTA